MRTSIFIGLLTILLAQTACGGKSHSAGRGGAQTGGAPSGGGSAIAGADTGGRQAEPPDIADASSTGGNDGGASSTGGNDGGASSAGGSDGGASSAGGSDGDRQTGGAASGGASAIAGADTGGRQAEPPDIADASSTGGGDSVDSTQPITDQDGATPAVDAADSGRELVYEDDAIDDASAARLSELGGGFGCGDLKPGDLLLVERSVRLVDPTAPDAPHAEPTPREWAYLAVEKLAHCPDVLDRQFVDSVFPYLVVAAEGPDLQSAIYAARALDELSGYTDLLTPDQVTDAYALATRLMADSDVEYRMVGLGLLGQLLRHLDAEQMLDAFGSLLSRFQQWQAKQEVLSWDDGTDREATLEHLTVDVFLYGCSYVQDIQQAVDAFCALSVAFENAQLGTSELSSVAGLARVLPEPERGQAVDIIILGLTKSDGWFSRTSGPYTPAHFANDALLAIQSSLTQDEVQRALDAITSQSDHQYYEEVFGPTVELLEARLAASG